MMVVLFNFDDYSSISVLTYANLPGRNEFYTAFPKVGTGGMPSSQVYQLVGGHPWQAHQAGNSNYQNACAIRVSCALNYSNHPLPVYSNNAGQQKTEKGDDNKNYMLDATSLLSYMLKAYPNNPPLHLVNQTPDQFLNAIKGKWGIYIMIPKSRTDFGASGHADFLALPVAYRVAILSMQKKFIFGSYSKFLSYEVIFQIIFSYHYCVRLRMYFYRENRKCNI